MHKLCESQLRQWALENRDDITTVLIALKRMDYSFRVHFGEAVTLYHIEQAWAEIWQESRNDNA